MMMRIKNAWVFGLVAAVCLSGLIMCGAESPAEEKGLSPVETKALTTEYSLEALESIDETNAAAEAQKLAAEIEADN